MVKVGKATGATIVVVLVVIAAGFFIPTPYSASKATTFGTTSTHTVTTLQSITTSQLILKANSTILNPGDYVDVSAQIAPQSELRVTWNASDTVYVYIFNSSQFVDYYSQGTAFANIASEKDITVGTMSVNVSQNDTYYIVIQNPHTGILGYGESNVEIFYALASVTYAKVLASYSTFASPYNATVTSSTTCWIPLWNRYLGSQMKCG